MAHFYRPPEGPREKVVEGVLWCEEASLFIIQVRHLLRGLEETHGPSPCQTDGLSIAGTLAAIYDGLKERGEDVEAFGILFVSEGTWQKLTE